jgi:hypothetical protein
MVTFGTVFLLCSTSNLENVLGNHFISEQYKRVQWFKLHFLQNTPPCVTVLFCLRQQTCWKYSWKSYCESLFSSDVTFLIITKAPSLQCWFQWRGQVKISAGVRSQECGGCSSVVTLFFTKKSLTKTDRCAGTLSWRRTQLLVLQFSEPFVLTASLRRRRKSLCISLLTVANSVNYTSEFQERFAAATDN